MSRWRRRWKGRDPRQFGLTRRGLLKFGGALGAGLALPSLVGDAAAGQAASPTRLLVLYSMQGMLQEGWQMLGMQPGDFALTGLGEEEWAPILQPLERHARDLLILDNLSMVSALTEADGVADPHAVGHVHSLTAAPIVPVGAAAAISSAPSFDQIIAQAVGRPDRVPSLEYAVGPLGAHRAFFSAARSVVPAEQDPMAAWRRLFGGTEAEADDPRSAAQERVLALASGQFQAVAPRLGAADRGRLEQHLDLLSDLTRRVRWLGEIECEVPAPDVPPELLVRWEPAYYEQALAAFSDLAVAAFSCDVTRVISLNLGDLPPHLCDAPPGDIHADYAHAIAGSAEARAVMTRYGAAHAGHLAALLDRLAATPDADGGSLLDNTCVLWVSEVGDGAHDFQRFPAVLAGRLGGAWETGRLVRFAHSVRNPSPRSGMLPEVGPAHSQLLVRIAREMGVDIDSVGLPSVANPDGGRIDLTGALSF